jgi:hypothetical protein
VGSPQMPGPVIRIAPKPRRATRSWPPMENVPDLAALTVLMPHSYDGSKERKRRQALRIHDSCELGRAWVGRPLVQQVTRKSRPPLERIGLLCWFLLQVLVSQLLNGNNPLPGPTNSGARAGTDKTAQSAKIAIAGADSVRRLRPTQPPDFGNGAHHVSTGQVSNDSQN